MELSRFDVMLNQKLVQQLLPQQLQGGNIMMSTFVILIIIYIWSLSIVQMHL